MEFGPSSAVRDLRASVDAHGFAIVRKIIAPEITERFLEALHQVYELDSAGKIEGISEGEREALDRGDVWPNALGRYTGLDFATYFSAPLLSSVTKRLLKKPEPVMHTLITVSDRFPQSIRGIQMHTDGIVQGTVDAVVAMWSPLHACGTRAPGLSLVSAGKLSVLSYLQKAFPDKQIPGWNSSTDWGTAFYEQDLKRAFGEPITPELEPGDVVIFTNWTIHGTQSISGHRSAIVQRWKGKTWRHNSFGTRWDIPRWIFNARRRYPT
jgi:hypothetical protein